jgi:hypothetical protein
VRRPSSPLRIPGVYIIRGVSLVKMLSSANTIEIRDIQERRKLSLRQAISPKNRQMMTINARSKWQSRSFAGIPSLIKLLMMKFGMTEQVREALKSRTKKRTAMNGYCVFMTTFWRFRERRKRAVAK